MQFKSITTSVKLAIQSFYSKLHYIWCTLEHVCTCYRYTNFSIEYTDVLQGSYRFLTHATTSYCCLMLKSLLWHASLNGKLPGYRQLWDGISLLFKSSSTYCAQRAVLEVLNEKKKEKKKKEGVIC